MSLSGLQNGRPSDLVNEGGREKPEYNQSLSASNDVNGGTHTHIVDWEGPNDPQNPMNWSPTRKWATIALVSTITFNT